MSRITHEQARVMLDSLDDYARMDCGVNAIGPRTTLEQYIAQQEADDTRYELTDKGRELLGGGE